MLNSVKHEILNAYKYINIKTSAFLGSDKARMLYFLLINVKMLNNYWHLNIYEQENFTLS